MRFSFSQISMFKNCQRSWYYRYIEKLPVVLGPQLKKGSQVHLLLEHFETFKNLKSSNIETSNFSNIETSNFSNVEMLNDENFKNFNEFEKQDFLEAFNNPEVFQIVENFSNSELGKTILSRKSIREFEFMFNEKIEPTFEKESSIFIGYIDRINIFDGQIELIDYKTGKYKEPKFQDFSQLLIYAVYIFQRYNFKKINLRFVYVEHNLENSITLNYNDYEIHKFMLLNDIQNILKCSNIENFKNLNIENFKNSNISNFKCSVKKLCNWCDFKEFCQEFQNSEFNVSEVSNI